MRRERKGEKGNCEMSGEGKEGSDEEQEKRKRDISKRSKVLGFLHGEAKGNLRCAANASLPGSAHRQLPNFE